MRLLFVIYLFIMTKKGEIMEIQEKVKNIKNEIKECEKLLIGIGSEWKKDGNADIKAAYNKLNEIIKEKDYFIVTTLTDAEIFESELNRERITAPCGNDTWRQCSKACTKDIWEYGEIPDDICPHCKAPMTGNTVAADVYIEEGYMPQWNAYTLWLTRTLNKKLLILELGEGFKTPTVIRWPFEKTAYVNKKAYLYRINEKFSQISEELRGCSEGIPVNSLELLRKF